MVKELKRRTANSIGLRSIHPAHVECTLQMREVLWIARTSSGRASKESGRSEIRPQKAIAKSAYRRLRVRRDSATHFCRLRT
jgi:hypothetical protein